MNQRLYRSRDDRVIAGVAGGVADYFGVDPSIVRIVWAVLTLFSGGLLFLLYVIMWIVVPEEPYDWAGQYGAPPVPPAPSAVPEASGPPATGDGVSEATGPTSDAAAFAPAAADAAAAAGAPEMAADAGHPPAATPPAGAWVAPASTTAWTATPPVDPRAARRAERAARREERRANRDTSGAIIFGLILILIGAVFLVQMYVPEIDPGRFWPIVLVVLGIVLLVAAIRPRSGTPPSA